jgi:hypothetical protein
LFQLRNGGFRMGSVGNEDLEDLRSSDLAGQMFWFRM